MSAEEAIDDGKQKKGEYIEKLIALLEEYPKILLVMCDNIGSHHMQKIRRSLRGKAILLMGKNTLMRKGIRMHKDKNPKWEALLPKIWGNIGLVFTKSDLNQIKSLLLATTVPAAAKSGIVAPQDVVVPKGLTTLEPTKTSFLQALNIASKINKGSVEIINDVSLIKKGDKVGSSEATLLQMLDIKPFTYGLIINSVYDDGTVYDAEVLNLTDDDIVRGFLKGVSNVASLSLATHFPTVAAFPHAVLNGYKNVLSIAFSTDYSFPQADKAKSAASAAPAASTAAPTAAAAGGGKKEEAKKEEPKKEEKAESDDMGFDLFG